MWRVLTACNQCVFVLFFFPLSFDLLYAFSFFSVVYTHADETAVRPPTDGWEMNTGGVAPCPTLRYL